MFKAKGLWIIGLILFTTGFIFSASAVLTTEEAQRFLSTYLQNPPQNWPKKGPKKSDIPPGEQGAQIRQGIAILEQTSVLAGPHKKIAKNNLNCIHCHPAGPSGLPGTRPGQLPYLNVIHEYPKLDTKTMKIITLQDRIRGMFGGGRGQLTDESIPMKALMAYMSWLGRYTQPGAPLKGSYLKPLPPISIPADPERGRKAYTQFCTSCHGAQGLGMQNPQFNTGGGYAIPPIAGNDTYTDSGHMASIPIFARFIYGYMPLGATPERPQLTLEQAYDIAAYVNTQLPRGHDPDISSLYPNPRFRPAYIALPDFFADNTSKFNRARFGPYTEKEVLER